MATELNVDFSLTYIVSGYKGIAWTALRFAESDNCAHGSDRDEWQDCSRGHADCYQAVCGACSKVTWRDCDGPDVLVESGYDYDRVECVMVGDNRIFTFDVSDLTPVSDYCAGCGQTGCGH